MSQLHTGIGRHGAALFQALQLKGCKPLAVGVSVPYLDNISTVKSSESKLGACFGWGLSFRDIYDDADYVLHGLSNFNVFKANRALKVLTIHDLIPLIAPNQVSHSYHLQMKFLIPRAVRMADRVICVSEWTKATCEQLYPQYSDKFIYIPNGVSSTGRVPSSGYEVGPNLLAVSRYETYKNFGLLVKIVKKLPKNYVLHVVTDALGIKWLEEFARDELNRGAIITYTGLSSTEIISLMEQSSALIHTSRFEGFCLPASEMICLGKPVIFLSGSGIDEVVGSAGIGLNTERVDEWIASILRVHSDYKEWSARVEARRSDFESWDQVAEKTLLVYN